MQRIKIPLFAVIFCLASEFFTPLFGQDQFLPFFGGEEITCTQGNFDNDGENTENATHTQNSSMAYAWDFVPSGIRCRGIPIVSPVRGTVKAVYPTGNNGGWGHTVIIEDSTGCHKLHHLSKVFVMKGQAVFSSQVVGLCGNTGHVIPSRDRNGNIIGDGSHIHHQKCDECDLNCDSIESFYELVSSYEWEISDNDPEKHRKVGIARARNTYQSENKFIFDLLYNLSGGQYALGEPNLNFLLGGDGEPGIVTYVPWSDRLTDNLYILRYPGGTAGNCAMVYDALNGAHSAVLICRGFYESWDSNKGPASVLGVPIRAEYIISENPTTVFQPFMWGFMKWSQQNGIKMYDWAGRELQYSDNRKTFVSIPGGIRDGKKGPVSWDPAMSYFIIDALNENVNTLPFYRPIDDLHHLGKTTTYVQGFRIISPATNSEREPYPYFWVMFDAEPEPADYSDLIIPPIPNIPAYEMYTDIGRRKAYILHKFLPFYQKHGLADLGIPISKEITFVYKDNMTATVQFFSNGVLVSNNWFGETRRFSYPSLQAGWEEILDFYESPVGAISSSWEATTLSPMTIDLIALAKNSTPNEEAEPVSALTFIEQIPYPPDYRVAPLMVSGSNIPSFSYESVADSVEIGIEIINASPTASASESAISVLLSSDAIPSSDDRLIEDIYVPKMFGYQTIPYTIFFDLPISYPHGIYYLLAKADSENQIAEYSESDNTAVVSVEVKSRVIRMDRDWDGYFDKNAGGNDCDDTDPAIHPGAFDWGNNGIDENCDNTDAVHVPNTIYYDPSMGSLQNVINTLQDGDTLIVPDGNYFIDHLYFTGRNIKVISANGPSNTILDGSHSADSCVVFYNNESLETVFAGFTIQNCPDNGIEIFNNSAPFIHTMIIKDNLKNGIFIENSWRGIPPFIINCLIYNNKQAGLFSAVSSFSLQGSTVVFNGMEGVYVNGYTQAYLYYNIFAFNKGKGIQYSPISDSFMIVIRSDFFSNGGTENFNLFNYGETNLREDPVFRDIENGDFRLFPESPLIDKALSDYSRNPEKDIYGNPRLIGSLLDLGAFEFNPASYIQEQCFRFKIADETYSVSSNQTDKIQFIIDSCMQDNDTLILEDGVFLVEYIRNNWKNIKIKSAHGPKYTILDGSNSTYGFCVILEGGNRHTVTLAGVTIQNCNYGVEIAYSTPLLTNLILRWNKYSGVFIRNSWEFPIVASSLFDSNERYGIEILNSQYSIQGSTIVNNGSDGIHTQGITQGYPYYNIYAYNQGYGVYYEPGENSFIRDILSDYYNNGKPDNFENFMTGSWILTDDPLFKDKDNHDFCPQSGSPMIDRGMSGYTFPLDKDTNGNPRWVGPQLDLGACEHQIQ